MKYLVGICGLGKGHSNRQYEIIRKLGEKGHEVRICTFGEGLIYFSGESMNDLKQVRVHEVYVPLVPYKHDKLDIPRLISLNIKTFIPGIINNIRLFRQMKKEGFIPDVVIADYEPVVARYAYALKKPLVIIDQQSKFIFMPDADIRGFQCEEEKSRLGMFFPSFYRRYILSFYKVPGMELPPENELLYPIIRDEMAEAYDRFKKENNSESRPSFAVYFSTYLDQSTTQSYEEVIEVFKKFPDYTFEIFSSKLYESGISGGDNVSIHKNSRDEFMNSLVYGKGVISTAGHTTITEAMYCEKPYFAIPLPTYDQNYCAKFIADNRLGVEADMITEETLNAFIEHLDEFAGNIRTCENLVPKGDTLTYLISELERIGRGEDK